MKGVILFLFVLFQSIAIPSLGYADAIEAGVPFPSKYQLGDLQLVLNGTGTRKATWFKVKVYAAGLYLTKKSQSEQEILQSSSPHFLAMQFVRNVSAKQLRDGWKEGLKKNSGHFDTLQSALDLFNEGMVDVKEGDRIELAFYPKDKVVVAVAGQEPYEVVHPTFSHDLLAVWLGSSPPNGALKEGLLGK